MSNRCLCSHWQWGHRRMRSESKRLRAPELNMWLIRMPLFARPGLNNNQCNLLHLWWRLAPRTPLPSPTLSLSQNSRALCPSLSMPSVDEIAVFCQTSSPCPVVSLTSLYFCCCCCSPFLGVKKTHTVTHRHIYACCPTPFSHLFWGPHYYAWKYMHKSTGYLPLLPLNGFHPHIHGQTHTAQ